MSFDKDKYWQDRQDTKAFRDFFWDWRAQCKQQFGWKFIRSNTHMFNQRAFKSYIEIYNTLEDAHTAIFKPVEIDAPIEDEILDIKTTVNPSE